MKLRFTSTAAQDLALLQKDAGRERVLKAVLKTLALMEVNLRHPSLRTHEFTSLKGPRGEKVFEAYVQQRTPGAFRIFWYYGPEKDCISIKSIDSHP
jgi:hypothetical protein